MPEISVIIPTYKREKELLRALESLQKQTLTGFEIIVVDNCGRGKVRESVRKLNEHARRKVKYLEERQLGLHFARHAGAKAALGDILVFSDDDAAFSRNWLREYVSYFKKYPEMAAAGGPIKLVFEVPKPRWLENLMAGSKVFAPLSYMEPQDFFSLRYGNFFFGTNMAIRRDVLFKLGGFNPESFGKDYLGDGETGLLNKLRKAKIPIGYIPTAVAYHHIQEGRVSRGYMYQWQKNAGAADVYSLAHGRVPKNILDYLRFVSGLVFLNLKYWIGLVIVKGRKAPIELKIKMAVNRSLGQAGYMQRLFSDRKLQLLVTRKNWLDGKDF